MPIYDHACNNCKAKSDAMYQMKFVGDEQSLPDEIKQDISCNPSTCRKKKQLNDGTIWPRVIQASHIANQLNGTTVSEKELLAAKQNQRKTRSRAHFKNEVLPTIKDPGERRHFEKKFANTKNVDHEKIK